MRPHGNLGVDMRIILKRIFRKYGAGAMEWMQLGKDGDQ
jgi:hypothetical protein